MDDREEEFRRRLERISQSRAERTPPPPQRQVSRGAGGADVVAILTRLISYIVVPAVLFIALPWYVLNNLPALTAMLNLPTTATGLSDGVDTSETRDFSVRFDRIGAEYGDGHVANAEARPLTLAELARDGQFADGGTPVKDVTLFDANATCTLRPVAPGEKLVNVSVRGSGIDAPVQAVQAAELQDFLQDRVKEALRERQRLDLSEINQGRFSLIDVYVTDTSGPLYLVLQTFSSNTIWNLHAAPGVSIAHVAMISGGASGIAGDLGSATVEGIRARDFTVFSDVSLYGTPPEPDSFDCMALPYQQPNESWTSWKGSQEGNTLDGNLLFGQSHGFDAFEYWYRKTLGASPNDNAVVAALARAALVGPVPAEPTAFPPQDGLQLRLMRHDLVFTGTAADREKAFTDHYTGLLNAAAGGDIAALTRPEIEVAAQADQPAEVAVEGDDAPFLVELAIKGTPWEQEFQAMIDMTASNFERRVGFRDVLPLASMLKEGEAMPPADQQMLYAMLRAPQAMEHHCRETLGEIALRCRVLQSETLRTGDDTFSVDVTFGYVPNYAIGALEKNSGWAFVDAFLPDTTADAPLDTPEARRAFLRRLTKVCDTLRAELGTCLISTAGFYLDQPARFSGTNLSVWAAGWVSVYAPDNPFETDKVAKRAEELWAQSN